MLLDVGSTAMLVGFASPAIFALPPSPLNELEFAPAILLITPEDMEIMRTRLFDESAMYMRRSELSMPTPSGLFNLVFVARLPPTVYPAVPVPATVLMMPVLLAIILITLHELAKYMLPEAATIAMPFGPHTVAAFADPPSPVLTACPSPATVEMMPTANVVHREVVIKADF